MNFFRPSVFGYPARPPPKFTPLPIPPSLEVGPLAIPAILVMSDTPLYSLDANLP